MSIFKFKAGSIYRRKDNGMIFLCLKAGELRENDSQFLAYMWWDGYYGQSNMYNLQKCKESWDEIK